MNVQSLCLVSSMPRYPQALQEVPMVCFLGLTCWKNKEILVDYLSLNTPFPGVTDAAQDLPDQFQGCHTRHTAQIFWWTHQACPATCSPRGIRWRCNGHFWYQTGSERRVHNQKTWSGLQKKGDITLATTYLNVRSGQRQATAVLTCWRPVQRLCNVNHVDNDRLDSISFAFNLEALQKIDLKPSKEFIYIYFSKVRAFTLAIRRGIL